MRDRPAQVVTDAIDEAGGTAICAYLTGGYPTKRAFLAHLDGALATADLVEVGVPFSDPMADGLTIQKSSRVALEQGVSLTWILDELERRPSSSETPILLMGYYNPFFSFGLDRLAGALSAASVSGLIVPDLPTEESEPLRLLLDDEGLALVPLVTPTTPDDRLERITSSGGGFVYAVTTSGVTGGDTVIDPRVTDYLDRVRAVSLLPVLAGFGVRTQEQVRAIAPHVDGVVVGSAIIEAIDSGGDVALFVASLRTGRATAPTVG